MHHSCKFIFDFKYGFTDEEEPMDESPLPSPPPVPSRAIESDDEDLLPATPPPSSAAHNGVKEGRGRRKKLVDKTFMDKDGYLGE